MGGSDVSLNALGVGAIMIVRGYMIVTTAARALLVTANLWLSELKKQKEKTEEAKLAWDLHFDATKPGPAQVKYYEDKLRGQ